MTLKSKLWTSVLPERAQDYQPVEARKIYYDPNNEDYDPTSEAGVGIFTLKHTPFPRSVSWHDKMYNLKEAGTLPPGWTQAAVDGHFYRGMIIEMEHTLLGEVEDDIMYCQGAEKLSRTMAFYIWAVNKFGGLAWNT